MKGGLLIFGLALALAAEAWGQTARFAEDGTLVIVDGVRRIRLPEISEEIDHVPTAPCVHAILKRHGEYFLVVTTSEFTRGYPPRGGAGGCGEEGYIEWLHVAGGKVVDSSANRFMSWRDNRDGGIDGWKGPIFSVTTTDMLELAPEGDKNIWQTIRYTFDAHHPEAGLKEAKEAPNAGAGEGG